MKIFYFFVIPTLLLLGFIAFVMISQKIQVRRYEKQEQLRIKRKKECYDCGHESDSGIHICNPEKYA